MIMGSYNGGRAEIVSGLMWQLTRTQWEYSAPVTWCV